MRYLILALFVVTIVPITAPIAQAEEGYWAPNRLPRSKAPQHLKSAVDAVVRMGEASGAFISNEGHILLSRHQIRNYLMAGEKRDDFLVAIENKVLGPVETRGQIVYESPNNDIAVIQVKDLKSPCAPVARIPILENQAIWVLSANYHLPSNKINGRDIDQSTSEIRENKSGIWISRGNVTSLTVTPDEMGMTGFNSDAEGIYGFSGGPILNGHGQIVGVVSRAGGVHPTAVNLESKTEEQRCDFYSYNPFLHIGETTLSSPHVSREFFSCFGSRSYSLKDQWYSEFAAEVGEALPWAKCEN